MNDSEHISFNKKAPELLSPAGDFSAFLGAINAGADAVYLGGDAYGARAYAKNFSREEIIEALDYAHIHGRKIYLTVNTLTKSKELSKLYNYLLPLYKAGLDGVIVQDFGVFCLIHDTFPDLPIHVSTQMAVSSVEGAAMLQKMGASRIVPARELTLPEIKEIHDLGIETECFIHGSMCYSYSGICLFSSFLGGRSGNRGRCAGPCRQPYIFTPGTAVKESSFLKGTNKEQYLLSLKDLCTLKLLPKLIDAGITSFKIEGRMKAPAYAAGTAAIYRKYIDLYLKGEKPYVVDKEDLEALRGLYLRTDLQEGYYEKTKSEKMVSVSSPSYNKTNDDYCALLNDTYCRKKEPVCVDAAVRFATGKNAEITVRIPDSQDNLTLSGDIVLKAEKAPLQKEDLIRRFKKSTEGLFSFSLTETEISGDAFLPVGSINCLRRRAEQALLDKMHEETALRPVNHKDYHETVNYNDNHETGNYKENFETSNYKDNPDKENSGSNVSVPASKPNYKIFVTTKEQFEAALTCMQEGDGIVIPTERIGEFDTSLAQITVFYSLPAVFRSPMKESLERIISKAEEDSDVCGYYCNQTDSVGFLRRLGVRKPVICDYGVIAANNYSIFAVSEFSDAFTADIELTAEELRKLNLSRAEIFAYGKVPLMQSANCVYNTTGRCLKTGGQAAEFGYLKDRKNISFPVLPHCNEKVCYNTIYNSVPISLHKHFKAVAALGNGTLQLRFSDESASETKLVLGIFNDLRNGENPKNVPYDFTNGHFIKGVL